VDALNARSAAGTDTFSYPDPPIVTNATGCPLPAGVATADCPTRGGTTVTIVGEDFSEAGLSVKIGTADCSNIRVLDMQTCVFVFVSCKCAPLMRAEIDMLHSHFAQSVLFFLRF